MLYEILVLYAVASPIFYINCVKFGVRLFKEPEKTAKEPTVKVQKKKQTPEMTARQKIDAQIIANMDRYTGDSKNQVKITR